MINTAADYDFVDLTDCPTGRFGGDVMPLRVGDAQDQRRMEDIAFLYEGIRDKVGALYGLTRRGVMYEPYFHPGSASDARRNSYYPTPISVPLTKKISSVQMTDLHDYMTSAAAAGDTGVRFLTKAISAIPTIDQSDVQYFILDHARQVFKTEFEGVGPVAADRQDFARGKPVAKTPVLTLFEDMKRFDRPCGFLNFDVATQCDSSCFEHQGTGYPLPVTNSLMYRMSYNPVMANRSYAWLCLLRTGIELFSIPIQYLNANSIKVWMLYSAYNTSIFDGSPGHTDSDFRTGLVDITQYLVTGVSDGVMKFLSHSGLARNLISYIEGLYGWTEQSPGGTCLQQHISISLATELIVEFVPNGRTRWW